MAPQQATAPPATPTLAATISMRAEKSRIGGLIFASGVHSGESPPPPQENAGMPSQALSSGTSVVLAAWPPVERPTKHATAPWRVASLGGMLPQQIGGQIVGAGGKGKPLRDGVGHLTGDGTGY